MRRIRRTRRLAAVAALATGVLAGAGAAAPAQAARAQAAARDGGGACSLGNGIKHVVGLQFDNVHLTRDDPDVPSDLEQMPHLLSFLKRNGTVLSNDHDVLSHTATNVLSAQTGLYQDRHGVPQSNSFRYFNPDGTTNPAVSFAYWTDPLYDYSTATPSDTTYNMIYSADRARNPTGRNVNAPAPWVPFTRAGCDVGEVGTSNTVLENIATDVPTVFGPDSPQAAEVKADPAKATADLVGLAVHCAKGSAKCADGQADRLPDEPGGYQGYRALFGNAEVAPGIHPGGPVTSLSGTVITDGKGHAGFPGFDALTPDNSLAYTADMQEHGVPVTYAYLSDTHTDHGHGGGDLGPGEAGYVAQLKSYDQAFATFFDRLRRDGITTANTLFVVTTDEGDHFVGGAPSPTGCDGVHVPCTYGTKGEINVNLTGLLAAQAKNTTPFGIHSDPAPSLYVTGNPARTDAVTRGLARDAARLTYTDPLTGTTKPLTHSMADSVEEKILHYVTADPARTPTLTLFSGENEYVYGGAANCGTSCVSEPPAYAWNHGGVYPDMTTIWMGLAGPGVRRLGVDHRTWADQTDVRPTTLALLGLRDDYQVDGRVLVEDLASAALPSSLRAHRAALLRLGATYKQLLAGPGRFGLDTLAASTRALTSTDDGTYTSVENRLIRLGAERDALTARIRRVLLGAAFDGRPVDERQARSLDAQGRALLAAAHRLATS